MNELSDFVKGYLERSAKTRAVQQAALEKKREKWATKLSAMSNDQLQEELDYANGWWADAAFEFADSGRGDGGWGTMEYHGSIVGEMERRGLIQPLAEAQP